jgi:hypothetical protein
VRYDPSAWYCHGASPQVGSGPSSGRSHRGRRHNNSWIAREGLPVAQGPTLSALAISSPMTLPNLSTAIDKWPSSGSSLASALGR